MLLIDDRTPPPSLPGRPVWEPDWRTVAWVALAALATIGTALTAGFPSFVLLCVAIGCGAHAIERALPYGDGLREYRQ